MSSADLIKSVWTQARVSSRAPLQGANFYLQQNMSAPANDTADTQRPLAADQADSCSSHSSERQERVEELTATNDISTVSDVDEMLEIFKAITGQEGARGTRKTPLPSSSLVPPTQHRGTDQRSIQKRADDQ